ncbi:PRLI-interacting factor [Wolffia australiana]
MNDPSQMMNRNFGMWQPPIPTPPMDEAMAFGNQRKPNWSNWKSRKAQDKWKKAPAAGYMPPRLTELQSQNRAKARRFYPKKKFARFAPYAPRNTTSFIMRAKKSGGITTTISPCPVTPATLPTPTIHPSREQLGDMAKEEWGVDGYGSMKGLIRLRSPTGDEDDEADDGSSESDVEEHAEVERRLDHDLSRFEMVYPYLLEHRVDDQDAHIAQLEEENLTLKERLFLMETELADLRRRLRALETVSGPDANPNDGSNEMKPNEEDVASETEGGGDVSSEKSVGD